jgi:hypothetical protein
LDGAFTSVDTSKNIIGVGGNVLFLIKHRTDVELTKIVTRMLLTPIPLLTDSRYQDVINNKFLSSCYNTISKSGFTTHRIGGSAGDNGATEEQLAFFEANQGCFPNVAGAVLHLPVGGGKWRLY